MAISVNSVYRTVLSIINKEGRGYLTPDQFNRIGAQVQLDLLEKSFFDYYRAMNRKKSFVVNDEYGDLPRNIKEKIDILSKEATLSIASGLATLPSDLYRIINITSDSRTINLQEVKKSELSYINASKLTKPTSQYPVYYLESASANTANQATTSQTSGTTITTTSGVIETTTYPVVVSATVTAKTFTYDTYSANILADATALGHILKGGSIPTTGVPFRVYTNTAASGSAGTIVSNYFQNVLFTEDDALTAHPYPSATASITLNSYNSAILPGMEISGTITNAFGTGTITIPEGITVRTNTNTSSKSVLVLETGAGAEPGTGTIYTWSTAPWKGDTLTFKTTNSANTNIKFLPTTIASAQIDYVKIPQEPKWGFTRTSNNAYNYQASTSYDFELHKSEQVNLVIKILAHAGVIVKDPTLIQMAGNEENKKIQLEITK
jgi:hypothetical protein